MNHPIEALVLRPVNLTSTNWSVSRHRSRCTVFARDERTARRIASNEFRIAVARTMGQPIPTCPWLDEDEVVCMKVSVQSGISPNMEGIVLIAD